MLVMHTAAAKHPAHLLITCTFIFPSSHRSGEATLTAFAAPRDLASEVMAWLPLKQLQISLRELDKRGNLPHVQIFTTSTLCDCVSKVFLRCLRKRKSKKGKNGECGVFFPGRGEVICQWGCVYCVLFCPLPPQMVWLFLTGPSLSVTQSHIQLSGIWWK